MEEYAFAFSEGKYSYSMFQKSFDCIARKLSSEKAAALLIASEKLKIMASLWKKHSKRLFEEGAYCLKYF